MKKLVILQGILPFYRKYFFNELGKIYDLTVVHSGLALSDETDLFSEKVLEVINFRKFKWQVGLFRTLIELQPDIIVGGDDLKYVNWLISRYLTRSKVIWSWWGVDENRNKLLSRIKLKYLFPRKDNFLFYDRCSLNKVRNYGIDKKRLFLANNTVYVEQSTFIKNFEKRFSFLNVGSLDDRKQNDVLIRCFSKLVQLRGGQYKLYLIGEGAQKDYLLSLVREYSMQDNIFLVGRIENYQELKFFYDLSLASVSFGQAGLAILQSMAFGVPFLTKENAITGGELSNVMNGVNGILCEDSESSLLESLVWCVNNHLKCQEMGFNAFTYYRTSASVNGMLKAFKSAIQ